MVSSLAGAFGLLALLLAAVGLYGVMAYTVARRTREIGIRMAIGSSATAVLWLIGREAMVLVGAGVAAGMAAGVLAARLIAGSLAGVSPADPAAILGAIAVMLAVSGAAAAVPARRAARIDPLAALRYE